MEDSYSATARAQFRSCSLAQPACQWLRESKKTRTQTIATKSRANAATHLR
jgi:hypothetical protein